MYISMNEPAKIMLYERMGRAAGPNTVAKYTQRRMDGVSSATPYRKWENRNMLFVFECMSMWFPHSINLTSSTQTIGNIKLRKFFSELMYIVFSTFRFNCTRTFPSSGTPNFCWNKQNHSINYLARIDAKDECVRQELSKLPVEFWNTIRVSIYLVWDLLLRPTVLDRPSKSVDLRCKRVHLRIEANRISFS